MEKLKIEVCKKICKRNNCCSDINLCDGVIKDKCINRGRSCLENLNKAQFEYIVSDKNQDTYLKACPGSGKTEVLGIKSSYEINKWDKRNSGMAILTFTNSAEDEIRERVEGYLKTKVEYPHFLGTFTSWIHGYIAQPFIAMNFKYNGNEDGDKSITIIDSDSSSKFLKVYSTKWTYEKLGNIKANQYYFDKKICRYRYNGNLVKDGDKILERLSSNTLWRFEDLTRTKLKFWKNGYANYEDIENAVFGLLNRNTELAKTIAQRFSNIFIDECQDLSYIQLKILSVLRENGCSLHLIGDIDQSIYKFRNIEPNDIKEYIKNGDFKEKELNINYRSCQKIVDLCDEIIKRESNIKGEEKEKCSEPLIVLLYSQNKEQEVIEKFEKLIDKHKLSHEDSRIIVRNIGLKNKLLGVKSNEQPNKLEILAEGLYLQSKNLNIEEYKKGFIYICDAIGSIYFNESKHKNINNFYSPENVETHEWKVIVSKLIKCLVNNASLLDYNLTWTEWKKALRNTLELTLYSIDELKGCSIVLPNIRSGNSNKTLNQTLFNNNSNKIRYDISTIHACKGLSIDAVLFLSTYKKPVTSNGNSESGSYWRQWFNTENVEEKNRIAYVGFSRAKYLLALGIPKPSSFSDEDMKFLKERGFKIIDIDDEV